MIPRRERARRLLRQLGSLMAVVVVAAGVGGALGVGMSELTSNNEPAGPSAPTPRSTATVAATTSTPAASSEDPLDQVRVTVLSAVLHPASTPSGQRRRRARLGVRVRVQNRSTKRVVPPRPSLLAARQRIPTNPRADAPTTRLGPIDAGQAREVTLRFETAGAVTEQLTTQKRARVLVAGRSWPFTLIVGTPVGRSGAGPAAQ